MIGKKNVLFRKTHVMTSAIIRSFFTAIDVILRFVKHLVGMMKLISRIQASTHCTYSEIGFDNNWNGKGGLICVLKTCQNGQGLES